MASTRAAGIDSSNAEQARAWDGDEGRYWATHADRFDRSVARYEDAFLGAAAIAPAERVLDVGCGAGRTTLDAARRATSGVALGVDLSARMLDVARRRAERECVTNALFEQADAQLHPFGAAAFDVAISRTGAMFFGDPVAAFANIAGAVRPGGRLVLLVWQPLTENEWLREIFTAMAAGRALPAPRADAPGPLSMSDPDRVRWILTAAGFSSPRFDARRETMTFGDNPDDAHGFIAGLTGWMLDGLDAEGRTRALDALRVTMQTHETARGIEFGSAAWLVTAQRF